jgi:hypothetical protein
MEVREDFLEDDPCVSCVVRPACSCECNRSKTYTLLDSFVSRYFNCIPNDAELKEYGLSIINGGPNGRSKRRKNRKTSRRI